MNEQLINSIINKLERYYLVLPIKDRRDFFKNMYLYLEEYSYYQKIENYILEKQFESLLTLKRDNNFFRFLKYSFY